MNRMLIRNFFAVTVIGAALLAQTIYAGTMHDTDEDVIRQMVFHALDRLNKGDLTAVADFWDEDADYVGVDGALIKGRSNIQALFAKMTKTSMGHQTASIDEIRFITPEIATVDGSWTVTGAPVGRWTRTTADKGQRLRTGSEEEGSLALHLDSRNGRIHRQLS